MKPEVNADRALETFLEIVRIDSPSGHEGPLGERLLAELSTAGIRATRDVAGNLIGRRAGHGALAGQPTILLSAHLDTVQPGVGVKPQVRDGVITSDGTTILGADDKAGITAILEALHRANETGADARPVEVVFTVGEETGLVGAKRLDLAALTARQALVLDAVGPANTIVHRAPAQNSIEATVYGRAAHAGVAPEQGINAIQAAARGLALMTLGRIDEETTANFGVIAGGTASNIVPERVALKGEARSHDEAKLQRQTQHMVSLLQQGAEAMGARAEVRVTRSYGALRVPESSPLIRTASAAVRLAGLEPRLAATGGGSDANVLHAAGIEAVNLGAGFINPHSVAEQIAVADLVKVCEVVLAVLTVEA